MEEGCLLLDNKQHKYSEKYYIAVHNKDSEKMNNNTLQLKTEHGQNFDIPEGGSLGLLALGYVGVMLWREKRQQMAKGKQQKSTPSKTAS